jgi:hypothetical protein
MMDMDSGELRLPMVGLNADEQASLRATLQAYGAIE